MIYTIEIPIIKIIQVDVEAISEVFAMSEALEEALDQKLITFPEYEYMTNHNISNGFDLDMKVIDKR